ncbi:MAG: DUF2911 domain-containing protein [Edaphobacter sp.]
MPLRSLTILACTAILATAGFAQAPPASPPATAEVTLNGKAVSIHYNSPRLKGRAIGSELAPYGKIWRTGANPATTLITKANLKIGTLSVPAGTYTVYTLPNANRWLLIINKQNGQWGTEYHEDQDLGRTPMTSKPASASQEDMSISFENTKGNSTELHVKWGKTDEFVKVTAE